MRHDTRETPSPCRLTTNNHHVDERFVLTHDGLFQGLVASGRHGPAAVVCRDHGVWSHHVHSVGPPRRLLGWPDTCRKSLVRKQSQQAGTAHVPNVLPANWPRVSRSECPPDYFFFKKFFSFMVIFTNIMALYLLN